MGITVKTGTIRKLIVDGYGEVNAECGLKDDFQPIEPFQVNGEMALVTWYRQGNREFNGRFVVFIERYD